MVIREARRRHNRRVVLNCGKRHVNLRVGEAFYVKISNYYYCKGIKNILNKSSSLKLVIIITIMCFKVIVIVV